MSSDPKSLGALFDAHCAAEFETRDIDATMATMGVHPHVTHVPTMTGGDGHEAVRNFYANYFVGRGPDGELLTAPLSWRLTPDQKEAISDFWKNDPGIRHQRDAVATFLRTP